MVKREKMPAVIPFRLQGRFFRPQKVGEFLPPLEGDEYVEMADGLVITSRTLYERIEGSRSVVVLKRRPFPKRLWYSYKASRRHLGIVESIRNAWTISRRCR